MKGKQIDSKRVLLNFSIEHENCMKIIFDWCLKWYSMLGLLYCLKVGFSLNSIPSLNCY